MQRLATVVKIFCLLPFLTGGADLVDGVALLHTAGSRLDGEIRTDPVLNSQIRFWGAIWFGYGIILWRTTSDLRKNAGLFKVLCAILALSGLGRLVSAIQFGSPGAVLTGAMAIELFGAAGLWSWHASSLRRDAPGSGNI
jgi:hypothetical protein